MTSEKDLTTLIISQEQELHKFEVRSNLTKISKLLSPEYYEFNPAGKSLLLTDTINRLPKTDDKTITEAQ